MVSLDIERLTISERLELVERLWSSATSDDLAALSIEERLDLAATIAGTIPEDEWPAPGQALLSSLARASDELHRDIAAGKPLGSSAEDFFSDIRRRFP
jgi:hypothetical protein